MVTWVRLTHSHQYSTEHYFCLVLYENIGRLFFLYLLYFFGLTLAAAYLLLRGYTQADGIRRRQICFLLLATVVGLGGGVTNFLTDLTGILPYGQTIVFLYPLLIFYGMFLPRVEVRI